MTKEPSKQEMLELWIVCQEFFNDYGMDYKFPEADKLVTTISEIVGYMTEEDEAPDYCTTCAGTGEGMYDGASCTSCRGRGY